MRTLAIHRPRRPWGALRQGGRGTRPPGSSTPSSSTRRDGGHRRSTSCKGRRISMNSPVRTCSVVGHPAGAGGLCSSGPGAAASDGPLDGAERPEPHADAPGRPGAPAGPRILDRGELFPLRLPGRDQLRDPIRASGRLVCLLGEARRSSRVSITTRTSDKYAAPAFQIVDNALAAECADQETAELLDPPVGPSVDDLVTAIASLEGYEATDPVDITVDGYQGKEFTLTSVSHGCGATWATADRINRHGERRDQLAACHRRRWRARLDQRRVPPRYSGSRRSRRQTSHGFGADRALGLRLARSSWAHHRHRFQWDPDAGRPSGRQPAGT